MAERIKAEPQPLFETTPKGEATRLYDGTIINPIGAPKPEPTLSTETPPIKRLPGPLRDTAPHVIRPSPEGEETDFTWQTFAGHSNPADRD